MLCAAAPPRPASKWNSLNFDAVERELEEGDDPEMLQTEDARAFELMNRRKEAPLEAPAGSNVAPGEEFQHVQASSGPTMIFATLNKRQPGGLKWNKTALTDLSTQWREVRVALRCAVRRRRRQ